jgi:hypothetical protein
MWKCQKKKKKKKSYLIIYSIRDIEPNIGTQGEKENMAPETFS